MEKSIQELGKEYGDACRALYDCLFGWLIKFLSKLLK